MNLQEFITFRNKIQDVEITSYGLKGTYEINEKADLDLISKLDESEIREVFFKETNDTANHKSLKIGDEIIISIEGSKFSNYYEKFDDFLSVNRHKLLHEDFFIVEIDYHHAHDNSNILIENYLHIQKIIEFLKKLSEYQKDSNGFLELFFNKPDKICSVVIDYKKSDLEEININNSITELDKHVFDKSDEEARIKLFTNEMINLLSLEGYTFKSLLKKWDTIHISYKSTFQIYLSEFSFDKIKTSSQEYFHELTDRIYSTINKFSAYILAIPVAYILILRFFSFDGNSFAKDSFLMIIGALYFIIIWFVLLNNLSKAFKTIEKDITKFIDRIKNEVHLKEITDSLKSQKKKLIPSQKRKIWLVRIISLIILIMTMAAYYHIYSDKIEIIIDNAQLPTTIHRK